MTITNLRDLLTVTAEALDRGCPPSARTTAAVRMCDGSSAVGHAASAGFFLRREGDGG